MTIVTAVLLLTLDRSQAGAQTASPTRLTLAEAIAFARQNNSRVHEATDAVEQARIARGVAQSAFRPKVVPTVLGAIGQPDLSSQTYGINVSQRFLSGTQVGASVNTSAARNQLGTYYYTDTTFLITQPLFGGPGREAIRHDLDFAEQQVDALAARQRVTEQRVVVDVATAYYEIVSQLQMVATVEKARERVAKLLDVSRAKLAIGKVSQLDVLRAEQLLREAESHVLDARAAVDDARDQLLQLMGRPGGLMFTVDPEIPVALDGVDIDKAVQTAIVNRPDLQNARRAVDQAAQAATATHRLSLPELDMKLALTRRETASALGSSFGLDRFRLVPFASISMPIDRPGERETALLREQRARADLDRLHAQIEIDVRRAVRQRDRLAHALGSADAAVDFATKEVDVASERFQRGLSNNLDLVSAETDLLSAESRRINVKAALAVANLNLKATLGTLDGDRQ